MAGYMNGYTSSSMTYDTAPALTASLEKHVVLRTDGVFQGSWAKEKDAMNFCKRMVKTHEKQRYVILEAKKEVGTKTPEIEVEEIK